MKGALFLGCTIPVRAQHYEVSAREVAKHLGIELIDIPHFGCCGFPVKSVDHKKYLIMAARNLALAEKEGLDIWALCSACYGSLSEANHLLKENEEMKKEVNQVLKEFGLKYEGKVEVKHFIRVLYEDYGLSNLRLKVRKSLEGLNFAPHYGCHYLRPSKIHKTGEDVEFPKSLDELIEITGAKSLSYYNKLNCCGGAVLAIDEELALRIANEKLKEVAKSGADAIILICPFCDIMYEQNQRRINSKLGENYKIPVLFYTQILGLALGIPVEKLGFEFNRIKPKDILSFLGK